jgi:FkbM family methyltransferase
VRLVKRLEIARERAKVVLTRYPRLYDSLRRPYALARFLLRRPHDREYEVFSHYTHRDGVFLDVGANAGMSALSFRIYNKRSPIVSIEPNPFHEADLRFVARFVKPFSYRILAAADREGSMTLHIPTYQAVPLTTEASLVRSEVTSSPSLRSRLGPKMDSDGFEVVSREVPVARLDSLGLDPGFIKLDVQGYEKAALIGLEETLRRCRPILFIESPDSELRDWLAERDYAGFRYLPGERRLVARVQDALNLVFVPVEELGMKGTLTAGLHDRPPRTSHRASP